MIFFRIGRGHVPAGEGGISDSLMIILYINVGLFSSKGSHIPDFINNKQYIFAEFPLVLIASNISPSRPNARICLENTSS